MKNSHFIALIVVVVLLVCLMATLTVQAQSWEKMQKESEGGVVDDIVEVNGKIFISQYSWLLRSDDNGATWSHVLYNKALAAGYSGSVNSEFATDKKLIVSGDSIYFGNQFSPDGGLTWQTWSIDASTLPTYYFHPTALNIKGKNIYMGTYIQGILKSTDVGKTFAPMNNGYPYYYYYDTPRAIEFYNSRPVVSSVKGIHYWNGNTWINCTGTGLPTTTVNGSTGYLIDRLRFLGSVWLASTNYGIYYSNNMGTTWQRCDAISSITGLKPWSMYSAPPVFYNLDVSQGIIFVCHESDIYISYDAAVTWKHVRLPDEVLSRRIIASGGNYLIATSNGVYKSTDGGTTWQSTNHGFEGKSFSIYPGNDEGYVASYGAGILKSSNHGKTLTPFNAGLSLNHASIKAIASDEIISSVVRYYNYAGTTQGWDYQHHRSTVDKPQWTPINNIQLEQIFSMDISSNGDYIAAGTTPSVNYLQGLYLSEDKGQTWSNIFNGITNNGIREDLTLGTMFDGDTLYAGVSYGGIYKTWNKGATWSAFSAGFTLPTDENSLINPDVLWHILKLEKYNNHIYAIATVWDGSVGYDVSVLYHSTDWGKHWSKVSYPSLSPAIWQSGLANLEITVDGILLASFFSDDTYTSSRIIASYDYGATWKYLTPDFPDKFIGSFGVLGDYLYASGTKGLWRTPAPSRATMKIIAGSAKGNRYDEVVVPVKVIGFKDVLSGQFSVKWDASVASFVGVEGFGVSGLEASNFGANQASNGVLTFSWNEPNLISQTLPDSSIWFSIRFRLIGFYGSSTVVQILNTPLTVEVLDKDFNEVGTKTRDGKITIDNLLLTGKVQYGNKQPWPGITLALSGADSQINTAGSDGSFAFGISPQSVDDEFTITPTFTGEFNAEAAIDVADIAALRRHILQTEVLKNPFAILAGDVNQSHSLSTADILFIQALILGEIKTFPGDKAWTFSPSGFSFQSESPFLHPEEIKIKLTSPIGNSDITGAKYGDVNLSYLSQPDGRIASGNPVVFDIRQEEILSESEIEIPVMVQNFKDISAFQFVLNWPKEKLEFIEVKELKVGARFGIQNIESGELGILWDDVLGKSISLNDNDEIFRLKFRVSTLDETAYKNLNMAGNVNPTVYDQHLSKVASKVVWSEHDMAAGVFNVYPNPFSQKLFISVYSSTHTENSLSFMDMAGKQLSKYRVNVKPGQNVFEFTTGELSGGVYILKIQSENDSRMIRVIRK
jgi:photosystem II stability/assembly factor-like uncharacterized protein